MKTGRRDHGSEGDTRYKGLPESKQFQYSTGAFSDATYARLQNLSLSYRLAGPADPESASVDPFGVCSGTEPAHRLQIRGLDPETMSTSAMPPPADIHGRIDDWFLIVHMQNFIES